MANTSLEQAPALSLIDVRRSFAQGQERLTVLDAASLTLRRGEIVALVGPSGAGKSTLLQIAGLLERPSSGEVLISGRACGELPDALRTTLRRRRIGFVYQNHHLLPEFSALENVVLPQLIAGKGRREAVERAKILLDIVGLADRARHRPGRLSGGEQQRVAIARSLANRPLILLADEPTGNLDPRTAEKVFDELIGLVRRGGLAALIATHNMNLAKRMDRVLAIRNGLLIEVDAAAIEAAMIVEPEPPVEERDRGGDQPASAESIEAVSVDSVSAELPPPPPAEALGRDNDATPEESLPDPAWRRVDSLTDDRVEADGDHANAAMSPETEDKAESLLHILHAVEALARERGVNHEPDRATAGESGVDPDDPEDMTPSEAMDRNTSVGMDQGHAKEWMAYPPPDSFVEQNPSETEDADGAPESGWESEIAIPDMEDHQPLDSVARDIRAAGAAGDSPRQAEEEPPGGKPTPDADWPPLEEADDLPDSDPVDLPAFIDPRKRRRD